MTSSLMGSWTQLQTRARCPKGPFIRARLRYSHASCVPSPSTSVPTFLKCLDSRQCSKRHPGFARLHAFFLISPLPSRPRAQTRGDVRKRTLCNRLTADIRNIRRGSCSHVCHLSPLGMTCMQVFDSVARDVILGGMEGYNGTILAYGQTGSGKTFTITGGPERYVDRGLIPRAISLIYAEQPARPLHSYTVTSSLAFELEQELTWPACQ